MAGYSGADRQRWVAEDPAQKRTDRDDFARDRGRLVHSAALRRLSAKTQVLAPGTDDFIRNRLTHSLEVAQIGREFGAALGCDADVVDTACLAHDLGHPPFGHHGEGVLDELAADIGGFEGNAQSLRILTRLEAKRFHPDGRSAGLNLTRASLDATTKYPWLRGHGPRVTAKFGAYADDLPVFEWIRAGASPGRRCIEAQVMDFSDDVAYSVHDLEDGIASGRIDPRAILDDREMDPVLAVAMGVYAVGRSHDDLAAALDRIRSRSVIPAGHDGSRVSLARLKDMTSRLIGHFVQAVDEAMLAPTGGAAGPGAGPAVGRAVDGGRSLTRYDADLEIPDEVAAEIALLKACAAHFVMYSDERRAVMAEQDTVVRGLVAAYLAEPERRLDPDLLADWHVATSDVGRRRVVIDQVASLTDARAYELYRRWC